MNDDLRRSNLVNDQIVANRKSAELGVACRLANIGSMADPHGSIFDASDKPSGRPAIVCGYVLKYFFEIREGSAFIADLHALRYRLKSAATSSSLAKSR